MQRTKHVTKEVDAILTADWHLREDSPVCRLDDFWEAQWRKVRFVADLQRKYKCPVMCAGDLFHHWKPSPYLLTKTMEELPNQFHVVYGNHDLPQHNMELAEKSGIRTLGQAGRITVLPTGHWKDESRQPSFLIDKGGKTMQVLVQHVMVYRGNLPWPGCTSPESNSYLKQHPDIDLILTGDNHQAFVAYDGDRVLVNPGSLTRQTAAQIDFKPRVYLWNALTNEVEPVYLPISDDVISREHIEQTEQRDSRIDAFITSLNSQWEAAISFEENMERFLAQNEIRDAVVQLIRKSMEEKQ